MLFKALAGPAQVSGGAQPSVSHVQTNTLPEPQAHGHFPHDPGVTWPLLFLQGILWGRCHLQSRLTLTSTAGHLHGHGGPCRQLAPTLLVAKLTTAGAASWRVGKQK